MSTEGRRDLAASRAEYFGGSSGEKTPSPRKPSYVGLSHSVNGYTPYAPYTNSCSRKISPPLHLPPSPPQGLNSVSLVLNQDNFQRSLNEFNDTMRDLCSIDMGRQRNNSDMTDNAAPSIVGLQQQDNFFQKSQIKKVITDGDRKCTEILTVFHSTPPTNTVVRSDGASSHQQNLVTKQIERLYGDSFSQLRLTSPEHHHHHHHHQQENGSPPHQQNGGSCDLSHSAPERKLSGGFFAKRFGISKMKDHSSGRKSLESPATPTSSFSSADTSRPLKVPAVFRLLRPEFREQLKQSSCKVPSPGEEGGKERIIPIQLETTSPTSSSSTPVRRTTTNTTPGAAVTNGERVIPIVRDTPPTAAGSSNGVTRRSVPTVIGFGRSSSHSNGGAFSARENRISTSSSSNGLRNGWGAGASNGVTPTSSSSSRESTVSPPPPPSTNGTKQLVVRKLSPLSPKHIVGPVGGSHHKPAPPAKPDHLKSPPMSPPVPLVEAADDPSVPRTSLAAVSQKLANHVDDESPVAAAAAPPVRNSASPPPAVTTPPPPAPQVAEPVEEPASPAEETLAEEEDPAPADLDTTAAPAVTAAAGEEQEEEEEGGPDPTSESVAATGDEAAADGKRVEDVAQQQQVEILPDEQERVEFGEYEDDVGEGEEVYPDYYQCGLRERELLCPIIEEDNESSASGSLSNLHHQNNGTPYAPDDPLLFSEQGELQDGNYFIKVLENEIFKFEEQICDFEEELTLGGEELPEEARDSILSTVGQAKLLMAQKLAQFRGLCDKNIHVTKEEDPFVPTCQDLAGFWDMVHIQVEQVHGKFEKLQKQRADGWKQEVIVVKKQTNNKTKSKKNTVNKPIKPAEKSEAAKARDEARKKMMEDRKRKMKENQNQNGASDLIIIM